MLSEIPSRPKYRRPRRLRVKRFPLTEEQILEWADAHYQRTGEWPNQKSGRVAETLQENWATLDSALKVGSRGLPAGSSLSKLLRARRGVLRSRPLLTVETILAWADAHHQRTGKWPKADGGVVAEAPRENWSAIALALRNGLRGLPPGSSLVQLLLDRRGVLSFRKRPPLTLPQILAWADAHHQRTGQWPTVNSGAIPGAPGESWRNICKSLWRRERGLAAPDSLANLLERERGVRNPQTQPLLTVEQTLAWADAFHKAERRWPTLKDGPIPDTNGETWQALDSALRAGGRGLGEGSSLARLLEQQRGVRNRKNLPPLRPEQILDWAREHHGRTGQWPNRRSGPVVAAPGEVWGAVEDALLAGLRGLPGGDSVARLLARWVGVRNLSNLPPLTLTQILHWADSHRERTGRWPNCHSGRVTDAPEETWVALDASLRIGRRGLPAGLSLARLLDQQRGVPNPKNRPPLTEAQILAWADEFHQRMGRWPGVKAGPIPGSGGETWMKLQHALERGQRGRPGGDSLSRLLRRHGRIPPIQSSKLQDEEKLSE